jgi:hypothetical protein
VPWPPRRGAGHGDGAVRVVADLEGAAGQVDGDLGRRPGPAAAARRRRRRRRCRRRRSRRRRAPTPAAGSRPVHDLDEADVGPWREARVGLDPGAEGGDRCGVDVVDDRDRVRVAHRHDADGEAVSRRRRGGGRRVRVVGLERDRGGARIGGPMSTVDLGDRDRRVAVHDGPAWSRRGCRRARPCRRRRGRRGRGRRRASRRPGPRCRTSRRSSRRRCGSP